MDKTRREKEKSIFNENLIKEFIEIVGQIVTTLDRPLPDKEDLHGNVKRYTDKKDKIYISKLIRNSLAVQRLYSSLDRIKEIIFTIEYLDGTFELQNDKVNREYLTVYFSRYLLVLDEQVINGILNFLSYFLDLPSKDDNLSELEVKTFVGLLDSELSGNLDLLLDNKDVSTILNIIPQVRFDYYGLPYIKGQPKKDQKKEINLQTNIENDYVQIIQLTKSLIILLKNYLNTLLDILEKKYKNVLGYDSPNDIITVKDEENGFLRGIPNNDQKIFIKIYNLREKSFKSFKIKELEILQNSTYPLIAETEFRGTPNEVTSINWEQGKNVSVNKKTLPRQEGKHIWTHTFRIIKTPITKSHLYENETIITDICLYLTFLSGNCVLTEESTINHSHKSNYHKKVYGFEYSECLVGIIEGIKKQDSKSRDFTELVLSKYRELIQPMSINNRLVRLWELVDILADYKCTDNTKELPDGYTEKTFRKKLEEIRVKVQNTYCEENSLNIDISEFMPLMTKKSIRQKVFALISEYKLGSSLEIDFTLVKKSISEAYEFRSKLTHSCKQKHNGRYIKDLNNYYLFICDIAYLLLLNYFEIYPKETLKLLKIDICGFIQDRNYYQKRSKNIENKNKEFENFVKILRGEKKPSSHTTTFTF